MLVRRVPGRRPSARPGSAPGHWQLVLLDHGLYRQIADDVRHHYAGLWRSLIFGDVEVWRVATNRYFHHQFLGHQDTCCGPQCRRFVCALCSHADCAALGCDRAAAF